MISDEEVNDVRKASVHAQDPKSPSVVFRSQTGAAAGGPQRQSQPKQVHDYLERFTAAGLSWPLSPEMSETDLEAELFPADSGKGREPTADRPLPDFAYIHEELQRYKHTTRQLLWEEYQAVHPDGYEYSCFCYFYQRWKQERDVVLRQEHRPGEKLFFDWAGATIPLCRHHSKPATRHCPTRLRGRSQWCHGGPKTRTKLETADRAKESLKPTAFSSTRRNVRKAQEGASSGGTG